MSFGQLLSTSLSAFRRALTAVFGSRRCQSIVVRDASHTTKATANSPGRQTPWGKCFLFLVMPSMLVCSSAQRQSRVRVREVRERQRSDGHCH